MHLENIPALRIGELEINPPIIQGGMGVRVSRANLASAVANTGCAGVIASAGLGLFENFPGREFEKLNRQAFREEIRKARSQSDGVIGVNIMVALSDNDGLIQAAVEENVDLIISGAGLPLSLPQYVGRKNIKLLPVVSSAKALRIICRRWNKSFNRLPDAVIVESAQAGGHLGYPYDDVVNNTTPSLEQTVREVIKVANSFVPKIPVLAAGGVFDGKDIADYLKMGASGVQMATRFVCTDECDAHENFKKAYLDATADDITIIQSPVGLPGRVIKNSFVERIKQGGTVPVRCEYKCLKTCEPGKAPYCIAKVLADAASGKLEESFVFAGSNAYRCNEIVSVKTLVGQLVEELRTALSDEAGLQEQVADK